MAEVRIERRSREDEAARRLEYEVFLEAGYLESNDSCVVEEYDHYARSEFLVATVDGEPAGVVRLIYADDSLPHRGLPTLAHYQIDDTWRQKILAMPEAKLGEFGTIAVLKKFRHGRATYLLKRRAIIYPALKGYRYGLSLIDAGLLRRLQAAGHILEQIGESKFFMGSETVPVITNAYRIPITLGRWTADLFRSTKKYS